MANTGTLLSYEDRRTPGWTLGTKIEKGTTSLTDAMLDARMMGWNERKEDIFDANGNQIPGFVAVRGEPTPGKTKTWGVFTPGYSVVSYPEAFAWGQSILDSSDLEIDTIGHYRDGARGFVSFRVPTSIQVGGKDQVDAYLTIISSHDGSAPVFATTMFSRVACTNMINGILAGKRGSGKYSIRHIGADPLSRRSLVDARESLGLVFSEIDEFSAIAERWAQEELTGAQVDEVLEHLFPIDKDETSNRVISRMTNAREAVEETFLYSPANEGLGHTAWALLQGATEWAQWRGEKDLTKRAESIMNGGHVRFGRKVVHAIEKVSPSLATV